MRRVTVAVVIAALVAPALASPASAQNKKSRHEIAADLERELREAREAEKEAAYRKATRNIPDKAQKPKDPWANMR